MSDIIYGKWKNQSALWAKNTIVLVLSILIVIKDYSASTVWILWLSFCLRNSADTAEMILAMMVLHQTMFCPPSDAVIAMSVNIVMSFMKARM